MFKHTLIAGCLLAFNGLTQAAHADALMPVEATPVATSPAPSVHRSLFSPVPRTIQSADSGITLGIGSMHQHYSETLSGRTLDSERGTLGAYSFGVGGQYDHFGWNAGLDYSQGNDAYTGGLEACGTRGCTITPASATTRNRMLDATLLADYGFSPLPDLAVLPEVFFGEHLWKRNIEGAGAIDESYSNLFYGMGLKVQYAQGRFVFGLEGRYGRTAAAHLNFDSQADFRLGSAPLYSVKAGVTWVALPWLDVYADDRFGSFSYGASSVQDLGGGVFAQEPHSRTLQNVVQIGVRIL